MSRTRKTYPPEFKAEAVRLVREDGMGVTRVAASLGVDPTLVRDRVCRADEAALAETPAATTVASMADERSRLRRENAVLREEREVLKKAVTYYAWREAQEAIGVDADALVRVHVRGLHRASRGTYGTARMTAALRKQGVVINHKRVARIMREEGLQGTPCRRFPTCPSALAGRIWRCSSSCTAARS